MTNRAEFERLLDVYGFRCERFGQDLSTHARAQVVSAFAALASAPVAGELVTVEVYVYREGNRYLGSALLPNDTPLRPGLNTLYAAPQASEAADTLTIDLDYADGASVQIEVHGTERMLRRLEAWLGGERSRIREQSRNAALEESASICDSVDNHANPMTARDCADAIRALKLPQADKDGPWCCERGEAQGVQVCQECAEISAGYQASMRGDRGGGQQRTCTCHPDDRPAGDCQQQYAATDCQQHAGDAERWRWATANDENAQMLYTIVQAYGGDQQKINERADFYRAALSATQTEQGERD